MRHPDFAEFTPPLLFCSPCMHPSPSFPVRALCLQPFSLAINNGLNHLHGGLVGWDKVNWTPRIYASEGAVGVGACLCSAPWHSHPPDHTLAEADHCRATSAHFLPPPYALPPSSQSSRTRRTTARRATRAPYRPPR